MICSNKIVLLSFFVFILLLSFSGCEGQSNKKIGQRIGGPFENAEFIYVGMPSELKSIDTSGGWNLPGQQIFISGTVYQADGKSPAENVIVYYYQTDVNGIYANNDNLNQEVRRHGYIRGWIKTGKDGKYGIYTIRPGSYPNTSIPAHIHLTIKEPNKLNEYYIDSAQFDDDPLFNQNERDKMKNRGGSGIVKLKKVDSIYSGKRNIILGLNIPDHPGDI